MLNSLSAPSRWKALPPSLRGRYADFIRRAWKLLPPVVTEVPGLGKMFLDPHDFVDSRIFNFHTWEPALTRYIRENVRAGDVAIDIGANIGYYTLLLSRAVGPTGKVYAFEPCESTLKRLNRMVGTNGLANVTVIPFGVSDKAERRTINQVRGNAGANSCGDVSDAGVSLCRLSDAVSAADLARASFVKIDVEGMESVVLSDIAEMELSSNLKIAVELWPGETMLKTFVERGFTVEMLPNDYSMASYAAGEAPMPVPLPSERDGIVDVVLTAPKGVSDARSRQ